MDKDTVDSIVEHIAKEFPSFGQKRDSLAGAMCSDVFITPVFALGVDIRHVVISVITQYRAKLEM